MNDVAIFYNNRIVTDNFPSSETDVWVFMGDFCLTPVRCLFNGNKVTVSTKTGIGTVDHDKEYDDWFKPKRNFLRIIASIIFLVPGILIGSFVKGLGYLSSSIRERHQLALQHYTPVDRTVGDDINRLNLVDLERELQDQYQDNHLHQPTKTLIIYAEPNTEINQDPGLLSFNPQKIILVGAKIVHNPGLRLDDDLARSDDWESDKIRNAFNTFVKQWKVDSVKDAIDDVPSRKSLFSFERYKRVYVV